MTSNERDQLIIQIKGGLTVCTSTQRKAFELIYSDATVKSPLINQCDLVFDGVSDTNINRAFLQVMTAVEYNMRVTYPFLING